MTSGHSSTTITPTGQARARAGAAATAGAAAAPAARDRSIARGEMWERIFGYTVLVLGAALLMIPFFWMISNSLKTDQEISDITQLLPADPQWRNYPEALERMGMEPSAWGYRFPALANTVVVTVLCVVFQIVSSSLAGYGFARYRFRGRDSVFMIMLSTMMLPAQVTMIPVFLLFRSLGWIDTLLPLIVPALFGTPFFIFMFRQFFAQVPEELLEAARIDGASHMGIYWRLMLPLSGPVIAIVAIYTFMFTWNDFLGPLIYLNSPENRTLTLALNAFNGQYGTTSVQLLMAASFVTMLPCIVLFFAAQRYFVDTGAATGLKG